MAARSRRRSRLRTTAVPTGFPMAKADGDGRRLGSDKRHRERAAATAHAVPAKGGEGGSLADAPEAGQDRAAARRRACDGPCGAGP